MTNDKFKFDSSINSNGIRKELLEMGINSDMAAEIILLLNKYAYIEYAQSHMERALQGIKELREVKQSTTCRVLLIAVMGLMISLIIGLTTLTTGLIIDKFY